MIDHRIYYPQQSIVPVNKANDNLVQDLNNKAKNNSTTFAQMFAKELNGVQFSQHALQRLQARNIKLEEADLTKLNNAVEKAAEKGAKDSLVLMNGNNLALVVSIKNKTVITALDSVSMKDNIFTNIDSAVII
ncbi:TIGR02530 family flagellar biosynthesis protein [Pelosinus sp. sgz500959]|uniref:TIGR02530 family flagellar biosynthesis protein n=1 Tax=Pelosinus sp. sgz500959 TaxID=3242472 RepID=UPI00366CCDD5